MYKRRMFVIERLIIKYRLIKAQYLFQIVKTTPANRDFCLTIFHFNIVQIIKDRIYLFNFIQVYQITSVAPEKIPLR
jgi:hypothetical protein